MLTLLKSGVNCFPILRKEAKEEKKEERWKWRWNLTPLNSFAMTNYFDYADQVIEGLINWHN